MIRRNQRRKVDEGDLHGGPALIVLRGADCDAGLADAPRADDRDQPMGAQRCKDIGHIRITTDEPG